MTGTAARATVRPFLDGEWAEGQTSYWVEDKFSGERLAEVAVPGRTQVGRATAQLQRAFESIALSPYRRFEILAGAAALLLERQDEFCAAITDDAGFTGADARREVDRAAETLRLCAEEAKRITGEMVPVDSASSGGNRIGFTVRRPVGVVCAITPFNSPLNTVVHKVAPAIAAGNAVVLKPAAQTPLTSAMLVALLLEAGLPPELIAFLPGGGSTVGQWLVEDPVPAFYAFTGSTAVGRQIHAGVGLRRTQLELGSLSSTIVCADAALASVATLCANAAFRKAGQVCTSVQRLYVQDSVVEEFINLRGAAADELPAGDPRVDSTRVGPLISAVEADRVQSWLVEATDAGAEVVRGGTRSGSVIDPTIMVGVDKDVRLMREEVFGPVLSIVPFTTIGQAVASANATPYGLAAGVFTGSIDDAMAAVRGLRVGSIHINETSSSRLDLMPYGGLKLSGHGKEGPHYAVREMTEESLVTLGSRPA